MVSIAQTVLPQPSWYSACVNGDPAPRWLGRLSVGEWCQNVDALSRVHSCRIPHVLAVSLLVLWSPMSGGSKTKRYGDGSCGRWALCTQAVKLSHSKLQHKRCTWYSMLALRVYQAAMQTLVVARDSCNTSNSTVTDCATATVTAASMMHDGSQVPSLLCPANPVLRWQLLPIAWHAVARVGLMNEKVAPPATPFLAAQRSLAGGVHRAPKGLRVRVAACIGKIGATRGRTCGIPFRNGRPPRPHSPNCPAPCAG